MTVATPRAHAARIAALRRWRPDRPDLIDAERQALTLANARQYLRGLVNGPHPPDAEQSLNLALILLCDGLEGGADGTT
jgi:hypothetical protein